MSRLTSFACAAALLLAIACARHAPTPVVHFTDAERRLIATLAQVGPPPADPTNRHADDPAAAALGQRLFFDAGLSGDGTLSCASCHSPELGLADGRQLPAGKGEASRHAPTLWNVAHHRWFFWDGRADTLWGQAAEPIEDPVEMAGDRLAVAHHLAGDAELRAGYERVFGKLPPLGDGARFPPRGRPGPDGDPLAAAWLGMQEADRDAVTGVLANIGKAIAAYERRLFRGGSPFDTFARGLATGNRRELAALAPSAQRGLKLFLGKGRCLTCHFGPQLTDREFHDTRVPPLPGRSADDSGRFGGIEKLRSRTSGAGTSASGASGAGAFTAGSRWSDDPEGSQAQLSRAVVAAGRSWGEFKTPGLRDVALSPPYMHQGQLPTLLAVVQYYNTLEGALPLGHHEESVLVPLGLTSQEELDLVAFLESLTGDPPDPALLRPPSSAGHDARER